MALRGKWQLQKLVVSYCDWGGSSRGIRAFMENHLPVLKECNPQLEVVTELIRGQHPHLKGLYREDSLTFSYIFVIHTCDQCLKRRGDAQGDGPSRLPRRTSKAKAIALYTKITRTNGLFV